MDVAQERTLQLDSEMMTSLSFLAANPKQLLAPILVQFLKT